MQFELVFVVALTLGTLLLLVTGRAKPDAIGLCLMIALVGAGIIDYHEAVSGFGNKAILTIAGLYVVGEGLTQTGAVEFLATLLTRVSGGGPRRMLLLTGLLVAAVSALLNDTAVVLVFIPVLVGMSRAGGVPVAHLLMPLAFAALLGGTCTLIGTSTNLLVSGVAESWHQAPIGMFEMTPLGVPLAIIGVLYMALFARRLLPARPTLSSMLATASHREYVTELAISRTSPLRGKAYATALAASRVQALFYVREEELIWPPFDDHEVKPGDIVMLHGSAEELVEMQALLGLRTVSGERFDPRRMSLFEIVVAPHSSVIGQRVEELRLASDYDAVALAILRAGRHIRERASRLVLRPGDVMLVLGDETTVARLAASNDFFLLTRIGQQMKLRGHASRALLVALLVVALFAMGPLIDAKRLPQPFVALLGALAMIATGCVTPRRAYRCIDWSILVFIAGTLALGAAMERTGLAARVAQVIVGGLADFGPAAVLSGFVMLCIVFNAVIAHSAVAVLLTPIAISTAQAWAANMHLDAAEPQAQAFLRACVLAIAFGGSLCFASPVGHQVNLMVFGPGGYRYGDFVRFGLPLALLCWAVLSLGLPWLTGL